MVRTELEIAASPEHVRAVFLDFSSYKEWHDSFIHFIETIPPNKDPFTLKKGDKLRAGFTGTVVEPTITNNEPDDFRWYGSSFAGAFAGEHYFSFLESKQTPGSTTFVHGEDHDGWLSFIMRPGWPAHKSVNDMYLRFSQDLKARAELRK